MYINNGNLFMYADDTSIIISAKTLEELEALVDVTLNQFNTYCCKNCLIINHEKTVCVMFKTRSKNIYKNINIVLNGNQLSLNRDTNFVGVILDEYLCWTPHIDQLCSKLIRSCFAITTLTSVLDRSSLIDVYYALFYSKLLYNIIIWSQSVDLHRVFVLQKRVVRIQLIFNMGYREIVIFI